jgi:hypothetical protein
MHRTSLLFLRQKNFANVGQSIKAGKVKESMSAKMIVSTSNRMIIAFCGKRRVGKDEAAKYLVESYGMQHLKISQRLKDACKVMFGFDQDQLEIYKEDIDPRWGVSPRQVMQFIGADVMQFEIQRIMPSIKRSFWIKSVCSEIHSNSGRDFVLSDVRFLHEVEELRRLGATIVRISRNKTHDEKVDSHISETECELIIPDFTISNTGSLHDLHSAVDAIVSKISTVAKEHEEQNKKR